MTKLWDRILDLMNNIVTGGICAFVLVFAILLTIPIWIIPFFIYRIVKDSTNK